MPDHRSLAGRGARAGLLLLLLGIAACVTPAEFRRLENRVIDLHRGQGGAERGRLADQGAQLDQLETTLSGLEGRIEVLEHRVQKALDEARAARAAAHGGATAVPATPEEPPNEPEAPVSKELKAYRDAYAKWRSGDSEGCVDQFSKFLQTYPTSDYADDATYWLADCYFKQGNYSAAVLRFDDVARQYPSGNKAPDALYRQGEALLRMGHGKAAGNAFEKVLRNYPDSARAPEARRQLDVLESG